MIFAKLFRILVCLGLAIPCLSQNAIQQAVDEFASDEQFANASLSISVVEVNSGEIVAAFDAHRSLIPASILKLVTTSVALETLGKDYQFSTDLLTDGVVDDEGLLRGNLHIKGYGDPTLGSHHFAQAENREVVLEKWVAAVKHHGIKSIGGQVIGDASWLEGGPLAASWPWEDIGNYYGAGAWGLNFHENLFFVHLRQKPQLGSQPGLVKLEPRIPNLLLINELRSAEAGSGDNAYIFGGPYAYSRFLRGTIPVGSGLFKIKGSVPDPPFFAAQELAMALQEAGVAVNEGATSSFEFERTGKRSLSEPQVFYHYYSPRLFDIAREANLKSVNIYCDALLKTLGKIKKDRGSYEAGVEVVLDFLQQKKIDTQGFTMVDGSGLSPRNTLTSTQMTALLVALGKNELFKNTLAVGGQSGTMKNLFRGSGCEGRISGKSGGMARVRSYAGYVQTGKGQELAFCIIANNYTGSSGAIRKKMERLMVRFCK